MLEVGKGKEEGRFILSLVGQARRRADVLGTVLGTKDTGRRRRRPAFEEDASSKRGRWPAHIAAGLIDALTGGVQTALGIRRRGQLIHPREARGGFTEACRMSPPGKQGRGNGKQRVFQAETTAQAEQRGCKAQRLEQARCQCTKNSTFPVGQEQVQGRQLPDPPGEVRKGAPFYCRYPGLT